MHRNLFEEIGVSINISIVASDDSVTPLLLSWSLVGILKSRK